MLHDFCILLLCLFLFFPSGGCTEPKEQIEGQEVFEPGDPELAAGPEFRQSKFRVYTLYRPQVQYRDFNGIFDIAPGSARIVRTFWKEKFNELTRPGHYGEFFIEYYDYMSSLAQSYPVNNREKELMLDSLEKSFKAFCLAVKILDAFEAFQKEQQKVYGD